MNEELNRSEQYSEKAVCNTIDSIMKEGKQMYVAYQEKGETGKEYTQEEIDLDMEAAKLAWPNFKTFLLVLKNHPALGPGAVDDSAVTPPNVATEVVVPDEQEDDDDSYTPEATRCPSRASNKSTPAVLSDDDYEEDEENPPKRSKGEETPLGLAKRRGNRQEQLSSWLPLERCKRMHR